MRDAAAWRAGAIVVAVLASSPAGAASPGVPELSSTAADYVGYAVDDLPDWFRTAVLQAADNTPADNPITNAGAELGRVLFYDARLSHNDSKSCASCHVQENGFSDPDQFSEGFEGGLTVRHSMGLSNAKFYSSGRLFWDERAATLEDQVLMPIQDAVEMGSNLVDLVAELGQTEFYPVLFERAFGDRQITSVRMAQAMAQFVRSMASYQSKFDQALAANNLGDVLTQQELNGHAIFTGSCGRCHGTDAQVVNNTHNIGLDTTNTDEGAGDGEFKAPSLRNIAVRDGFMHDGRFATLEEVIEFYSGGIQANPDLSRGLPVGGFGFNANQQAALLAFLETLTDDAFLTSSLFSDPFVTLDGDYNGDGVVDADDYTDWAAAFGEADADSGSGPVDASQYVLWRGNLGARWDDGNAGVASTSTSVPEPGAAALAGACLLAAFGGRRRPPRTDKRRGIVERRRVTPTPP